MGLNDLTTYLHLHDAAERYQVDFRVLREAIDAGTVRAVQTSSGDVLVAGEDVGVMNIAAQVEPSLGGAPIRAAEAAEKYDLPQNNLTRWADAGYIRVIERAPRRLILDEGDVQRVAEIFHRAYRETGSFVRAGWVLKRMLTPESLAV